MVLGFSFHAAVKTARLGLHSAVCGPGRASSPCAAMPVRCRGLWPWVPGAAGGAAHHHSLLHSEVRQQHVILHDVTGHLPEATQVPGQAVDEDCSFHARLPAKPRKEKAISLPCLQGLREGKPVSPPSQPLPSRTIHCRGTEGWETQNTHYNLQEESAQQGRGSHTKDQSGMACLY
jgi:hypothetical protein